MAIDEETIRTEFPPITNTQMQAYVERTGVSGKCLQCGHTNWAITPTEGWTALPVYLPSTKESKQLPVCSLVCNHCGNVWQIALSQLLENRPVAQESVDG